MLKRSISRFLLILASILWLFHAIVPHHHHNSQACLVPEPCQHDSYLHHEESCSHEHDNNTTSTCVFNQLAIIPQPIIRGNSILPEPLLIDLDLDYIQAILAYTHAIVFTSLKTHPVFIHSESSALYLAFIGHSIGLRAPPSV
jgi:hypothetical protein